MEKSTLAEQLRTKQRELGFVDDLIINRLTDDDIIDAYITCSCCGVKQVDTTELEFSIDNADDADSFLEITAKFSQARHMVNRAATPTNRSVRARRKPRR